MTEHVNIAERLNDVRGKADVFPNRICRASEIGHPCTRYLYYSIMEWDKREAPDPTLAAIYKDGNLHEKDTVVWLMAAGFNVIEAQKSFDVKGRNGKPVLTGHIDGYVDAGAEGVVPIEVKSFSPYTWNDLNTLQDFYHNSRYYVRGYPAQMMSYLFAANKEYGAFILKNKLTGLYKQIDVTLDFAEAENILTRAEYVMGAVDAKEPPPRYEGDDPEVCWRCPLKTVCMPSHETSGVGLGDESEVVKLLERREELKATLAALIPDEAAVLEKQIESADAAFKRAFYEAYPDAGKSIKKLMLGRFALSISAVPESVITRKGYNTIRVKPLAEAD